MLSDIPEAESLVMPLQEMACIELRKLTVNGVDLQPLRFPFPSIKGYLLLYGSPKTLAKNFEAQNKKTLIDGVEETREAFPCPVLAEASKLLRDQREDMAKILKSLHKKDGPLNGQKVKNVCFSVGGVVLHTTDAARSFEQHYYRDKDSARPTQVGSGEGCYIKAPPTFRGVYLGSCIDKNNVEAMSWGYTGNEGVGMSREGYQRRWLALHDPNLVSVRTLTTGTGKHKKHTTILIFEVEPEFRALCPDVSALALGAVSVAGAVEDAIRTLERSQVTLTKRYGAGAPLRPSLRVALYYQDNTAPRLIEYIAASRDETYRHLVNFRDRFGNRSIRTLMNSLGQNSYADHARWVRRLFKGTPLTRNEFLYTCKREPVVWSSASTEDDWHTLNTLRSIMEDYMQHTGEVTDPPNYQDMLKGHFEHVDPSVQPQYAMGVACSEAHNIAYQVGRALCAGTDKKKAVQAGSKMARRFEKSWIIPIPAQPRKFAHQLQKMVAIYIDKTKKPISDRAFKDAMEWTGKGTELVASRWTQREKVAFSLGYSHGRKLIRERLDAFAEHNNTH